MSHAWVMVDLTATGEVESHVRYLLGLTPSQLRLFEVLLNKEEDNRAVSSRHLQDELGLDSSVITRTLTALMNKGLVSRRYMLTGETAPRYHYTALSIEEFTQRVLDSVSELEKHLISAGLLESKGSAVNAEGKNDG
tara:strand:- start:32 stop:442 length:411 start_codon:yes stop_codon:yes gene_type:complete